MATIKPTFQNATGSVLAALRYNASDIDVPPGKYITGDFYHQENTLNGQGTGVDIYQVLGFTDVSSGSDPDPADVIYDYTLATVVPAAGIPATEKGVANGVATLDANALLDTDQLPPLSITSVYVVNSEALMLALTAEQGDVAIRTDLAKSFILADNDASELTNWKELLGSAGITGSLTSGGVLVASGTGTAITDTGLTYDAAADTLTVGVLDSGYFISVGGFTDMISGRGFGGITFGRDAAVGWKPGSAGGSEAPDSGFRRVSPGLVGVTSGGSNLGSLQAGNLTATALATPVTFNAIVNSGTPGSTTYGYKLVAVLNDGNGTAASAEVTTTTGAASLSSTDNNYISWAAVANAAAYKLYRTTGGASPPVLLATTTNTYVYDIGAAGTPETPPTTNTTGRVLVGDGSFTLPSVAFASEPSTGLRLISGSFMGITVAGTDRVGLTGSAFQVPAASIFQWSQSTVNDVSDLFLRRAAAASLQLGAAPNATPVANTLIIGESGSGTNIAGANGTISSGIGTGSGAGSTLTFKTPTPGASGETAQTQTTRLSLDQYGVNCHGAATYPNLTDYSALGGTSNVWTTAYLSRATLGSKSKVLTNNTSTPFATFTIADGAAYSGEIIYAVKSVSGTSTQNLKGRVQFSITREGTTYTPAIDEMGTQVLAALAGTLTGAIEISATAGVVTLAANFNSSLSAPTVTGLFRFDSVDAGLSLTFV